MNKEENKTIKYINPAQVIARESDSSKTGKKEQLIKKGLQLISKRGLDTVTVDDITNSCSMAKGTFYYYFKNKEDFIRTAVLGLWPNEVMDAVCKMKDATVVDKLCYYVTEYEKIMEERMGWDFCRAWARIALSDDSCIRLKNDMIQITSILEDARNKGEIKHETNCELISKLILSYVYGTSMLWDMDKEGMPISETNELFCTTLKSLLAPFLA